LFETFGLRDRRAYRSPRRRHAIRAAAGRSRQATRLPRWPIASVGGSARRPNITRDRRALSRKRTDTDRFPAEFVCGSRVGLSRGSPKPSSVAAYASARPSLRHSRR
jgi:hypothetical protein